MDMDFDDSVLRAMRRYVRLVSEALGLHGQSSYVQADDTISAYIALERRLARFPDRDLALLWDEDRGWSAAIETHSGEDLLVVAYYGKDVLPPPSAVAAWADEISGRAPAAGRPGKDDEPVSSARADDPLANRLAAYTVPLWADTFRFSLTDADALPTRADGRR
jgi:hypothetical protein